MNRKVDVSVSYKGVLKSLARLLRESNEDDVEQKGEDSLDSQVDRYFSEYESEAKNVKNEGRDFRMLTRRLLREETEDSDEKEKDEKSDVGKLTIDDINIKSFVTDVIRLVDNYDNLLEVKNTILRRAANYLTKNYESDVVSSFKEELLESHGVEIGKTQAEEEDEFQAPKAGFAGPMGGGA
jgi:flagellar biosynthesis GTPase FlhF